MAVMKYGSMDEFNEMVFKFAEIAIPLHLGFFIPFDL